MVMMRTVDFVQSLRNTAALAARRAERPDDAYGRLAVTCGTLVADLTTTLTSDGQQREVPGVVPIDPAFAEQIEAVRAELMRLDLERDSHAAEEIEGRVASLQRDLRR